MLMRRNAQEGFTLIELLVASALAVTVAIGIVTMEGSRVKMEEEIIARSGLRSEQGQVALATVQLGERIAMADWFTIDNGTGVFRFRIPDTAGCATAACLDNPANYRWDQYRLTAGILTLFTNTGAGCGTARTAARDVTGLTLTQTTTNTLDYVLSWDNGLAPPKNRTHVFRGRVVSRVLAAPGLQLSDVPPPPPTC